MTPPRQAAVSSAANVSRPARGFYSQCFRYGFIECAVKQRMQLFILVRIGAHPFRFGGVGSKTGLDDGAARLIQLSIEVGVQFGFSHRQFIVHFTLPSEREQLRAVLAATQVGAALPEGQFFPGARQTFRPPGMAEVPGAKPSVNEASFTGQTQEQSSGLHQVIGLAVVTGQGTCVAAQARDVLVKQLGIAHGVRADN